MGWHKTNFFVVLGLGVFLSRSWCSWDFEIWCFGFGSCLYEVKLSILGLQLVGLIVDLAVLVV